jgi:uncharacterized membrane protein YhaH (DUF805 family)
MATAEMLVPTRTSRLPRIGRLAWLLWTILIAVAAIGAGLLAVAFGYSEKVVVGSTTVMAPDRWVSLVITAVATLPAILVGIMRRHDRNRNGLDIAALYVASLALTALDAFGWNLSLTSLEIPNIPYFSSALIIMLVSIYSLIVLLFLPGDKGENRYGWRGDAPVVATTQVTRAAAAEAPAYSAVPTSPRNALEGAPKPSVTLTEQANGLRIPRSMFIGHTVGYLIALALTAAALSFAGFTQPTSYDAVFAFTTPPTVIHFAYMGLNPYAVIGLSVVAMFVWTDLTIRRRHDRGRSGVDAAIFQILLLASVIIHTFGNAPDIVGYLDAFLVLFGLYLFLVLVVLPGNRGENRYGPVPRPD